MIYFRQGSQVWQLVTILSFVGEFPYRSVGLIGNERVLKTLISKLTSPKTFRNPLTGDTLTCRLLTVSGKSSCKTVRLYKGALPILKWIHPSADQYYMESFWRHHFPGDSAHIERNHRVSEAALLCMSAGIEARPYLLPKLQNGSLLSIIPKEPVMFLAKNLKKINEVEMNKTMFTRMVGAIFSGGKCYAVYNTRDTAMRWSGMGEFKTLHSLTEIARMNANLSRMDSAILFGRSEEIALKTLRESEKDHRVEFRFDSIYRHIYFIPVDEFGIRQLRLFSVSDWKEKLLDLLFDPKTRSYDRGLFEYDACVNGVYVFSHFDGDIARLVRFREAIRNRPEPFEVLCYPHQLSFIKAYLEHLVTIKTLDIDLIESELNPKRRNRLDE